jgi:hypothetical protein
MKPHAFFKLVSATVFILTCTAIPVFAQRGGGSHGGGSGGFHGGGGGSFHSSGGSFGGGSFRGGSSSAPRMGAGFSRGSVGLSGAGASARFGGGFSGNGRSGSNTSRSFSTPANGSQRGSAFSSAPRAVADGQWHSFGGGSQGRNSASTGGGWRVSSGNRSASGGTASGTTRTVRSFSGQGGDVWENAPASRNMVPASRTLSNLRGSFAGNSVGNSIARNSGVPSNSSTISGSRLAPGASFGNSFRSNTFVVFGSQFRGGFHGGCWNCGFGFGFGFGFGWWPGWGLGFGWPGLYWYGPWWPGYVYPGYGYYGYPAGYMYYDPSAGNYSSPAPDENYPDAGMSATPDDQSSSRAVSLENSEVPVLFYLKDGAVYSGHNYWVADGQLHYFRLGGEESVIDLDQLDVQRTVDENAKSGVQFTLTPGPAKSAPTPKVPPTASPTPTPQMNLISAPPVRS